MALYSDKVMDHFQHPRNVGKLPDADGVGEVGNAKCGDIMRMYIQVDPETQVQPLRLRQCHRHQLYGYGDDQGQACFRGPAAHQPGSGGGSGRPSGP